MFAMVVWVILWLVLGYICFICCCLGICFNCLLAGVRLLICVLFALWSCVFLEGCFLGVFGCFLRVVVLWKLLCCRLVSVFWVYCCVFWLLFFCLGCCIG